ncbi:MAG TPA: hypothetical protein VMG10_18680 [Gemmataceae bacterium]|nr:hypothetical protein [Gemmataceae bacterium]
MTRLLTHLGLCALALTSTLSAHAVEPLTHEQFADLHLLIQPTEKESRWNRIPWLASLWEARRQAAAKGKPILLWEMDGHPLGCT